MQQTLLYAVPGSTTIVAPGPILATKVQQTLLRQAQHQLLRQAQQALSNWPKFYKFAPLLTSDKPTHHQPQKILYVSLARLSFKHTWPSG